MDSFEVEHLDFYGSDHRAIVIRCNHRPDVKSRRKKRRFRFDSLWMTDEGFKSILGNSWRLGGNQQCGKSFGVKLSYCATTLKVWSRETFRVLAQRKEKTQKVLEHLNCLDECGLQFYSHRANSEDQFAKESLRFPSY